MTGRLTYLLLTIAILALPGCARELRQTNGMTDVKGAYDNPATWLRAAGKHEAEGDLQRALIEYRLAMTVSPNDRTLAGNLQRVEQAIEKRTASLMKKAEEAAARGRVSKAKSLYLETLGLKPDHEEALAALRSQEQKRTLAGLKTKRKLARQYGAGNQKRAGGEGFAYSRKAVFNALEVGDSGQLSQELKRHQREYPDDKVLYREIVQSSLETADRHYKSEQWDKALSYLDMAEQLAKSDPAQLEAVNKARKAHARELYNQGVISYRTTPKSALKYWNYALKFDPDDEKSRLRIRSIGRLRSH